MTLVQSCCALHMLCFSRCLAVNFPGMQVVFCNNGRTCFSFFLNGLREMFLALDPRTRVFELCNFPSTRTRYTPHTPTTHTQFHVVAFLFLFSSLFPFSYFLLFFPFPLFSSFYGLLNFPRASAISRQPSWRADNFFQPWPLPHHTHSKYMLTRSQVSWLTAF